MQSNALFQESKRASYFHCTSWHRKATAAATNFRNHTPFSMPRRQPMRKATVFKQPFCSLTALIHPHCPSARQSEAHSVCQGEHRSSPPAPCLLGISQANTGGLGAIMLLNTAISKCELKHINPALRRGIFWGGGFFGGCFLTSGKASKENSKEAVPKLAALQAKQSSLRAHCSLPATSDYLLQSNKSFSP